MSGSTADVAAPAGARAPLRGVALPSEHGGWGLTLEPGLLGLLVAPSVAGACLAVAAVVAFVARTPLKLALVDRRRGRDVGRRAAHDTVSGSRRLDRGVRSSSTRS